MKDEKILIEKEKSDSLAKDYFMEMCGYNRARKNMDKVLKRCNDALEKIYDEFNIEVVISSYPGNCVNGKNICIDGINFECEGLEEIDSKAIKKIYFYLMTAGDMDFEDEAVLDQIYYDTWISSYVQACSDNMPNYIADKKKVNRSKFSHNFGPGFYGMSIREIKKFFDILSAEKLDMNMLECGLMAPLKSYAGFFVMTD